MCHRTEDVAGTGPTTVGADSGPSSPSSTGIKHWLKRPYELSVIVNRADVLERSDLATDAEIAQRTSVRDDCSQETA
jgi:hypothetical protein